MCGITGKLNLDGEVPVDPGLIDRMTGALHHRGPDGGGSYCSGPVGLGHRRLSIIDLSTGDQPMCNEDGTVWVVFNGEIYNFRELRADLQSRGHVFKSASDTEVIVHLYEELGEDCVNRLRGMFAFAVWDHRNQSLFLARDRVGIKPLYYVNTGSSFLFASEIKALLMDPDVAREVNSRAIDRFLTYYYLPGHETLLEGIFKLEPGHSLKVSNGRHVIRQYWDLRFSEAPSSLSFDQAVEELQNLLADAVRDHMISDVPVGVLLSGGVDSTGILRYCVDNSHHRLNTFTIGFEGASFADERPYARMAAERYNTNHHEITMAPADFQAFLPDYVRHMEEPVCEPPGVSLYFLSKLARDSGVKVLLSGEGGDEAFGGYLKYRNFVALERLKSMLGPAAGLISFALSTLSRATRNPGPARYGRLVDIAHSDYYFSCTSSPQTIFNQCKQELYRSDFADHVGSLRSDAPTHAMFSRLPGQSALHRMLYVDTKSWLPDDLLIKADKMTMAASVELRVPLLDHKILEFAASLPPSYKVSGLSTKRVLKAALKDSVPQEILFRKKAGFPLPYDHWLKHDLRSFVNDTLLADSASIGAYFQKPMLNKLVQDQRKGLVGGKEIFGLLALELWHQEFLSTCLVDANSVCA